MRKALWVGTLGSLAFTALLGYLLYLMVGYAGKNQNSALTIYGSVLFVAMPVLHGMAVGILSQLWQPQPWGVVVYGTFMSAFVMMVALLACQVEGMLCILMASPLVLGLVFIGSWLGWIVRQKDPPLRLSLPAVGTVSLIVGGGSITPAPEFDGEVRTSWWIAAPPERVWPHVLGIDTFPEPDWWLFRLGVGHPVRTQTDPDGYRECEISTGLMPERVIGREENRYLAFRVLATPPTMKEWNPFGEIHPAHLTETFRCREGEFRLVPERGGTRVLARSTYGLRMGPAWYWRLWSDSIVRHVHLRVADEMTRRATASPKG